MIWTWFDTATGAVLGWHHGPRPVDRRGLRAVVEGAVPAGHFVDPATLEVCPCGVFAPVIEGNAITGLPDDTRILRDGRLLATGDIVFAVDWPESVTLDLVHPRHLPLRVAMDLEPDVKAPDGLQAVPLAQDVRELRAAAYREVGSVTDQLDEIVKSLPADNPLRAKVMAVKARFPKKVKE